MKLILIRHGETAVNLAGKVHRRQDDASLSPLGLAQAQAIAGLCLEQGVEEVFTSPERRARETADVIARHLRLAPVVLSDLAERNWGIWAGRSWDVRLQQLNKLTLEERYNFIPPGGESWKRMDVRLERALERVVNSAAQTAAVVTHGGALRALVPIIEGLPKGLSLQSDFDNGSISTVEYRDGLYRMISRNVTSHLPVG
jgi:ribonuclease H / adenosylcobalamin/alpha-ribazole phosphatase